LALPFGNSCRLKMPPINFPTTINEKLGPEKLPIGWPWKLFLFSLLTVITALVIYSGLSFGYRPFLEQQVEAIDESIRALSEIIPEDQQKNLITFYSQLANLQAIFKKHVATSKIFGFLEKNTNQSIFYTNMDLRTAERKLSLDGIATGYDTFSQQLEAFNNTAEVESLVVNESTATEDLVKFKLFVILKPELFK